MFTVKPQKRIFDDFGSGEYGSVRGRRVHRGIDFGVWPGSIVCSPVEGKVTKLGYTNSNDLQWRYVQVTDADGFDHRLFYVSPSVTLQAFVKPGDVIGVAQNIAKRYNTAERTMTPHVHYEIKYNGEFINPEEFWNAS